MQFRLRLVVAIVLLLAAGIHPLVHVAAHDCPCVHGATVTVAVPTVAPELLAETAHPASIPLLIAATPAGDVPARAPPAA